MWRLWLLFLQEWVALKLIMVRKAINRQAPSRRVINLVTNSRVTNSRVISSPVFNRLTNSRDTSNPINNSP